MRLSCLNFTQRPTDVVVPQPDLNQILFTPLPQEDLDYAPGATWALAVTFLGGTTAIVFLTLAAVMVQCGS